MDMQIDGKLVKSERQKRAWSQQHLAAACGLGLRTIQRIERSGIASYESAQAIAACLDLQHSQLLKYGSRHTGRIVVKRGATATGMIASFIAGAVLMSVHTVVAEDVLIDLRVTENSGAAEETSLETAVYLEDGTEYEMRIKGGHRVVIVPEILPDSVVSITVRIYDFDAEDAKPLYTPRILVRSGSEGVIHIGDKVPFQIGDRDPLVPQSGSNPSDVLINITPTVQ